MNTTPVFKHDCEACIFLGHWCGRDLWYHKGVTETVIARFGNDGMDYISGFAFVGSEPWITKASELSEVHKGKFSSMEEVEAAGKLINEAAARKGK